MEIGAKLSAPGAVRAVVQVVAAELPERGRPHAADRDTVFNRGAVSGIFSVPAAGDRSGEPDRREGVCAAHRIVGKHAVGRQRILPEDRQGAVDIGVDADEPDRIVELSCPARIAVGVLLIDRDAGILEHRLCRIGKAERVRIKPCLELSDKRKTRTDRLLDLHADVRLTHSIGRNAPHRTPVHLLKKIGSAGDEVRTERRPVGLVAVPHINRAVEAHSRPSQQTVCQKEILKTPARSRRRWRGYRGRRQDRLFCRHVTARRVHGRVPSGQQRHRKEKSRRYFAQNHPLTAQC